MAAQAQATQRPGIAIDARKYLAPVAVPEPAFEIFYYGLDGKFRKIRGTFTKAERNTIMDALQAANRKNPFFAALYGFPEGQFGSEWTYA